jgi:hypothetical protein
MAELNIPRAPALPVAQQNYTKIYQDTFGNILRLYFNQLDTVNSGVLGPLGTRYLDAPHISASDSTDQYATADDTPTMVLWDTAEYINGFTLNPSGTATVDVAGFYKIDYSLQFTNTDNTAAHDVFIWLQENGTVIPNSATRFTVPVAKSASVPAYIVATSSIMFEADPSDEIGLWWATETAATSGGTKGVFMEHLPAQISPYARPANPSATGSITFLGRSR